MNIIVTWIYQSHELNYNTIHTHLFESICTPVHNLKFSETNRICALVDPCVWLHSLYIFFYIFFVLASNVLRNKIITVLNNLRDVRLVREYKILQICTRQFYISYNRNSFALKIVRAGRKPLVSILRVIDAILCICILKFTFSLCTEVTGFFCLL